MASFANEHLFNSQALAKAGSGMFSPQRRLIERNTLIYRFGKTIEGARLGNWWLDHSQYVLVNNWAAGHRLTLAHAARILCAIAHEWSNMTVLIRGVVQVPLMAYQGRSTPQILKKKNIEEFVNPDVSSSDASIIQLFIPGLEDEPINRKCVICGDPSYFDIGASHIFGVPGVPAGTVRH